MQLVRRIAFATGYAFCAAQPAFAHGEEAIFAIAFDGLLVVVAVVTIGLALKCSIWLRLLLIATYIASAWMILFIPGNWTCDVLSICGGWPEMGFLLALPAIACAVLYAAFAVFRRITRRNAL